MTLTELIILVLAVTHVIEVYNHGSIMAGLRARMESSNNEFVSELFQCMFCLSLWASAAIVLWFYVVDYEPAKYLVYILAIARGSNLLNDTTYRNSRTPNKHEE